MYTCICCNNDIQQVWTIQVRWRVLYKRHEPLALRTVFCVPNVSLDCPSLIPPSDFSIVYCNTCSAYIHCNTCSYYLCPAAMHLAAYSLTHVRAYVSMYVRPAR